MDEELLGHNDEVYCLALRGNGYVASGASRSIIIHSTSNKVEYRADNVFTGGVDGLCYFPNGSLVATKMRGMIA